jgi:hypothetical protein
VPLVPSEHARQAAVVFTGVAREVHSHSTPNVMSSLDPVEVTFAVEAVYKGATPRTTTIWTVAGGASCGYDFAEGRRYTVFAWLDEGRLEAGLCTGTVEESINPVAYQLPSGYAPGDDPPLNARSAIVIVAVVGTIAFAVWDRRRNPPAPLSAA